MSDPQFSRRVLLLGLLVLACAAALGEHRQPTGLFYCLALLGLYGEARAVKIPGFGIFNAGEGVYFALALLFGPVLGALPAALLGLLADSSRRRRVEIQIFNLGWALTTFSAVGLASQRLGPVWAGAAFIVFAAGLQTLGERRFSQVSLRTALGHQIQEMLTARPAAFGLAFLITSLQGNLWSILLLAFPLELVNALARVRALYQQLSDAYRQLETTQAELVASGRRAALGVMAAGIAHEINNPLAAAATYTHMLEASVKQKEAREDLQMLDKALQRCRTIVGQMLKYSRTSQSGEARSQVLTVLEDALMFSGRELAAAVDLDPGLAELPEVRMDPAELVQVVTNLMSNAYDATDGQGPIEVRGHHQEGRVTLRFLDRGPGISPQQVAHIFEPFFTTKEVGSGTGLGLSIAQGLAKAAGGELRLQSSEPGQTIFLLELPSA